MLRTVIRALSIVLARNYITAEKVVRKNINRQA